MSGHDGEVAFPAAERRPVLPDQQRRIDVLEVENPESPELRVVRRPAG